MIKRALLAIILLGLASLSLPRPSLAGEPDGRAIMDEVSRRHDADVETQTQRMVLVESGGTTTERVLRRYARKGADGLSRYLLVFDEPSGVRGVALLTWEKPGDNDQWTYLPALGNQLKRIAGGGRRNNFMGTDFAFEDLTIEDRDSFVYARQPDEMLDGQKAFVIDATPAKDSDSTSYERRRLHILQSNYMISRVEFFAKGNGRHIKTFVVEAMAPAGGQRWHATRTSRETRKDSHKTLTTTLSRSDASSDVPEEVFTHLYIQSKRHMR